MIEENAIVVGVDDNTATLEIVRRTPCGLCGQTRGCGVSLWGRLFAHKTSIFRAVNGINAKMDDMVIVGIDEQAVLFSSMRIYGIPLFFMLAGVAVASFIAPEESDVYTVLGAFIGLILGFAWLKLHTQGSGLDTRYQPVILRQSSRDVINIKCERGE